MTRVLINFISTIVIIIIVLFAVTRSKTELVAHARVLPNLSKKDKPTQIKEQKKISECILDFEWITEIIMLIDIEKISGEEAALIFLKKASKNTNKQYGFLRISADSLDLTLLDLVYENKIKFIHELVFYNPILYIFEARWINSVRVIYQKIRDEYITSRLC